MITNKITPDKITVLKPNQVFVFGSNKQGRHGKGAARDAVAYFDAKEGVGEGFTGGCYAFPTIEKLFPYTRVSAESLKKSSQKLLKAVEDNPDLEFLVTPLGLGLAGFEVAVIAEALKPLINKHNVRLPSVLIAYYDLQYQINKTVI